MKKVAFILIGVLLSFDGMTQCPTTALSSENEAPNNGAQFSDYSKVSNKLHISGSFDEQTFAFGGHQVQSVVTGPGRFNNYLMQLSTNGQVDWLKVVGEKYFNSYSNKLLSLNDGVVSAMDFTDTLILDQMYVADIQDVLLVRYDLFGNTEWVSQIQASSTVQVVSLATDDSDNIYVLGNFTDSVSIDGLSIQIEGSPQTLNGEIFLAKIDPFGNTMWLKYLGGGTGNDVAICMAYDNEKLFLSGFFTGEFTIGQDTYIAPNSDNNTFVAATDTAGEILWSKQLLSDRVRPWDIDIYDNTVILIGLFKNSVTLDQELLISNGGISDGFILALTEDGVIQSMKNIGGSDAEELTDIEVISEDLMLIAGNSNSERFSVNGLPFQNFASVPGNSNSNLFVIVFDNEIEASCMYYLESELGSSGMIEHLNQDTLWLIGGFATELPIQDTTLFANGGSTFVAKTCVGCDLLVNSNVSDKKDGNNQLTLSPNPATTTTTITLPKAGAYTIMALDAMGREFPLQKGVPRFEAGDSGYTIDTSNWPQGLYSITATTEDGVRYNTRLVVQRQ